MILATALFLGGDYSHWCVQNLEREAGALPPRPPATAPEYRVGSFSGCIENPVGRHAGFAR